MEDIEFFSELTFAGNEMWRIITLAVIIAFSYLLAKLISFFMNRSIPRLQEMGKAVLISAFQSVTQTITFVMVMLGIRLSLFFLIIPPPLDEFMHISTSVLVIIAIATMIYKLTNTVDTWLHRYSRNGDDQLDAMLTPVVGRTLRVIVVILALLQIAQTVSDQELTHILAGLGVGGLAIAFASQEAIRNFFGSLMIFSDKPFNIDDWVVVDGMNASVEEVGIRSTRIRTFDGYHVIIPNGELMNKTITNVQKRPFIRRWANIDITYDTPPEKVQEAIDIIREVLSGYAEHMPEDRPPKIYFEDFKAYSLSLLMVYWVTPPSYWDFVELNDQINKEIFHRFNEAEISFAFPTQTLHLAGDPKRQLKIEN